jgi:hypothetical protein
MYVSLLGISGALYLGVFEQPVRPKSIPSPYPSPHWREGMDVGGRSYRSRWCRSKLPLATSIDFTVEVAVHFTAGGHNGIHEFDAFFDSHPFPEDGSLNLDIFLQVAVFADHAPISELG